MNTPSLRPAPILSLVPRALSLVPASNSRPPVLVDGAYVIDEDRVDAIADGDPIGALLPAWTSEEVPWRSIVE